MATKDDHDAAVDEPTTPVATERTATTGLGALALAGIIGGSVVAAALLFGGGIAVGIALPDRVSIGVTHPGFPGGSMEQGFPGAQQGPRGDGDRRGDSD